MMAQGKKEEAEVLKKKVQCKVQEESKSLSAEEKEVEEKIKKNHDDHSEYHRSVCSDWKR